jgi:hypothetical protein
MGRKTRTVTVLQENAMYRQYAPTTEDIDNFRFEASSRLSDVLRGELDLDAGDIEDLADE